VEWLYEALEARLGERRFEAFRRHRKSIRQDLAAARTLLPADGEGAHLERFDRWLIAGELESAFDELAAAGEGGDCPPDFWRALCEAAQKLGLQEEVDAIRRRLGSSADVGMPQRRT
jgi:hypothetical protein